MTVSMLLYIVAHPCLTGTFNGSLDSDTRACGERVGLTFNLAWTTYGAGFSRSFKSRA